MQKMSVGGIVKLYENSFQNLRTNFVLNLPLK
jgi:hypothetical protein